ncbi:MAG: hypothetical protein PHG44_05230 [Lentisphaeria bacterium]|jgi:Fe-S oxidoreductase|nr:hypothetical protein [Lentisphaeria bacterium]MDY0176424.1 hypothetical protein [Lentisphaeria bacterium]NLZ59470.1 (Fe-S)-binding protein [Lentisphaerota bacterium]
MKIENFIEVIHACRYCFMCRHLSGSANVTFREADTPRVRAILLDNVLRQPELLAKPDLIDTLYAADLSGTCRSNCEKHFDEIGLLLAARQDLVAAGLAPPRVAALAEQFRQRPIKPELSGQGDTLYFIDYQSAALPEIPAAFERLMQAAGIQYRKAENACPGKVLQVLGYDDEARQRAESFAAAINVAKAKTLVVSNPAAYYTLSCDFPAWGIELNCQVMHSSEFLAALDLPYRKKAGPLYYLESDFLKNYCGGYEHPHRLLARLGAEQRDFGNNQEESYSCGEAALVLPQLNPKLARLMLDYVCARINDPAQDLLVCAAPYTRARLAEVKNLQVLSLEELAATLL